ncbi:hypothetical protein CASFOL_033986 [Castilleja foliolosa]|uniref:Uncharacterized protein n=1 Tax=Castilleja foliolosa TaxID=1961234 RepID=A0ABD3BYI1_9LAMI
MLKSISHLQYHDTTENGNRSPYSTPLLSSSSPNNSSSETTNTDESPPHSFRYDFKTLNFNYPQYSSYKSLATLKAHIGSVSCLALSGEFILSASQGKDIIVWQQPHLKPFTKFGHGHNSSVKALLTFGNRVLTAHQDSKIRVWKVSRSSENVFRLVDTLPTTKDYLNKFMKQSNYVQTRRHHKRLWIEHADTISCLAVSGGLIYSGSWDKTIKVWRSTDFKCLESIRAHDDAINALVARNGVVYSASADGKIKAWGKTSANNEVSHSLKGIMEGKKDVSVNSVAVTEDGVWVYGGGSDGYVTGWAGNEGLDGWKLVCKVRAHGMSVLCVCLAGEFLCSGSADKSIGVWRREAGGGLIRHMVIEGHEGPVKCLEASGTKVGCGFVVYSGSLDRSVRVWWVPNETGEDRESGVGVREKKMRVIE